VEAIQIILTGIDNDIYSTVDACPNACEMWKAIGRLKQARMAEIYDSSETKSRAEACIISQTLRYSEATSA
nr:hypothetical protein [Tanacetum cinerariifolium]